MNEPTIRKRPRAVVLGALAASLAVAGCGELNLRQELGLIGGGPDPFTVVANSPLEMPETVEDLPEPQPGARSLVEPTPEEDAQVALTGVTTESAAAPSSAETALLRDAGADGTSDAIRSQLQEDAESEGDWRLLDSVIGSDEENLDEALDASAEARRLSEEAQATVNPNLVLPEVEED